MLNGLYNLKHCSTEFLVLRPVNLICSRNESTRYGLLIIALPSYIV